MKKCIEKQLKFRKAAIDKIEMVSQAKAKFKRSAGCGFDKGFHGPSNQKNLVEILDIVVLGRKGRLSTEAELLEHAGAFVLARRKHSTVESAISALENLALDRCPGHGLFGLKRYVSQAVLACNIRLSGSKTRIKSLKCLRGEQNTDIKRYPRTA